jgi:twitching motility protein PilT
MVATPAIRATIRDDKIHQIQSMMQAGKKHGMQTMNDSLAQLVIAGDVKQDDALRNSTDPNELLRLLGEPIPGS